MTQKGFSAILVIVLVALIIGGGYLIYQKQFKPAPVPQPTSQSVSTPVPVSNNESTNSAETANWRTFTNVKYGFLFKYPQGHFLEESYASYDEQKLEIFRVTAQIGNPYISNAVPSIGVWIYKANALTLENWLKKYTTDQTPPNPNNQLVYLALDSKSKTTISNKSWVTFNAVTAKGGDYEIAITQKGNYVYALVLDKNNNHAKDPQISQKYQAFLTTFKFLDQDPSTYAPTPAELKGFPVYPGAKFVEKWITEPCTEENTPGYFYHYHICGSTTYTWESDNADKVYDFYQNDLAGTGWKLPNGGVRDSKNYGLAADIRHGDTVYTLYIIGENNKAKFVLSIPYK